MKNLLHYIILLVLCPLVWSCDNPDHKKIAIVQCSDDDWRQKMNREIEREAMLSDDIDLTIVSANDDNDTQISQLRNFAAQGYDLIIVSPNEARPLTPVIDSIYRAGIPVIIVDRDIESPNCTARVVADNKGIGASAARYANVLAPRGARVLEIYGRPGSTPADLRHIGFDSTLLATGGQILDVAVANWNLEEAQRATDSLLRIHPEVNVIYAHNDRMAIGASRASRALGRDDIRIIGIDAAPGIGIRAVADSVIDATFLYPTEGHRLLRTARAILDGEPFDTLTVLPASSAVDLSNADILLLQNQAIIAETDKMMRLKAQVDVFWQRHSAQTMLLWAAGAIILLLCITFFLLLKGYWLHKQHRQVLQEQNQILEQQRDTERALNQKLQQATQSKLAFFTNVSHDLRTPLTLVAEPIAQLSGADNLTPRQHDLMRIADKNVRILTRLINQILDLRKYQSGHLNLNLTETALGRAMADWYESFVSLARRRRISLVMEMSADDADKTVAVDLEKIERVFFNILSNAFKYTPDNGKITVRYAIDGQDIVFTVSDTGQGIPDSELARIFDRFYQVDRIHPNGSGIGLSLCRAFVELHTGTITVASQLTKGSTFTVTIPIRHTDTTDINAGKKITPADVSAELDNIDTEPQIDSGKPIVLVIDDNADFRQLLTQTMADTYNIICAADGHQGIRRAMRYVPDLIICDMMMPGMDGLECCRRLKGDVTTSHIPILMLTACSMDQQRVQGLESGADAYISKPFSSEVLMAQCTSLIENRARIRQIGASQSAHTAGARPELPATTSIDDEFYQRFLKFFMSQLDNADLTVDALAAEMGLERTQLYRKIKALTNYSPVELMRKLRLEQARRMLRATDRSISEIAYATGFSTPAYFTKCYRDAFGETPSETRK